MEKNKQTNKQLAIDAVAAREAVNVGMEELYQYVDNLCLHKMSAKLYHRLGQECERHVSKSLDNLLENVREKRERERENLKSQRCAHFIYNVFSC
jgi:hypothetical protein